MIKEKHFYLIRGLIREKEHWGRFVGELQKLFPDSKITTIDLPGAGEHFQKSTPFSIKGMVEEMRREYLVKKRPNEESHLVAISLGGMIACEWMKNHPQDFVSATLINTSVGGNSPVYDRLFPKALVYLLKVPFLKGRAREEHILKLVSNNPVVFEETLELWERILKERPVNLENTLRQLFAAAFFKADGFVPPIPVTILASVKDRMVNVKCSRAIAQKWNAKLREHPTGGHDLSVDDPEWIALMIKETIVRP